MITKNSKATILTLTMLILTNSLLPIKKPNIKTITGNVINNYITVSDFFLIPALSIAVNSLFKIDSINNFNQTISNSFALNNYKNIKLLSIIGIDQLIKNLPLKKQVTLGITAVIQQFIPKYLGIPFSQYSLTSAPIVALIAVSKKIYNNKHQGNKEQDK